MDTGQINTYTALILYDAAKLTVRDKLWHLFNTTLPLEDMVKQYQIREVFHFLTVMK